FRARGFPCEANGRRRQGRRHHLGQVHRNRRQRPGKAFAQSRVEGTRRSGNGSARSGRKSWALIGGVECAVLSALYTTALVAWIGDPGHLSEVDNLGYR